MSGSSVQPATSPSVTSSKPREVKNTRGFFERSIHIASSHVPKRNRSMFQHVGAIEVGKGIGWLLAGLSGVQLGWNMVRDAEQSFWSKYVFPGLGVLLGIGVAQSSSAGDKDVFGSDLVGTWGSDISEMAEKVKEKSPIKPDDVKMLQDLLMTMFQLRKKDENAANEDIAPLVIEMGRLQKENEEKGYTIERAKQIVELNATKEKRIAAHFESLFDKNAGNPHAGRVRESLSVLSRMLEPVGLSLSIGSDASKGGAALIISSTETYKGGPDGKKVYKPFIAVHTHPANLTAAFDMLSQELRGVVEKCQSESTSEEQMLASLNESSLEAFRVCLHKVGLIEDLGNVRAGYYTVNKDSGEVADVTELKEHIVHSLKQPQMKKLFLWLFNTEYKTAQIHQNIINPTDETPSPSGMSLDNLEVPRTIERGAEILGLKDLEFNNQNSEVNLLKGLLIYRWLSRKIGPSEELALNDEQFKEEVSKLKSKMGETLFGKLDTLVQRPSGDFRDSVGRLSSMPSTLIDKYFTKENLTNLYPEMRSSEIIAYLNEPINDADQYSRLFDILEVNKPN